MKDLLDKFIRHLDLESGFLNVYYETIKNQTSYVIKSDIKNINKTISEISKLNTRNKSLNKSRQIYFDQLAVSLKINKDEITISKIISEVQKPWKQSLIERKNKIMEVANKIQREVETNTYLLRYALNFNQHIIQIADNVLKSDLVYSKKGVKGERSDKIKIFDQKI